MSHTLNAPLASRREFLQSVALLAAAPAQRPADVTGADAWRSHFPALGQRINDRPLVYLDTAATALRPVEVTAAITDYYHTANANPGHGGTLHTLARRSGERYEASRQAVAKFINARDPSEIVWTRGTTDAINLAAASWGLANVKKDDEILLTVAEHY